jgi:hypothetical protein
MTRTEFAAGSATFIAVIAAGFLSVNTLNRHFTTKADKSPTSRDHIETRAPFTSSAACVDKDGSWKNWVWANVPMLSPKCAPDR